MAVAAVSERGLRPAPPTGMVTLELVLGPALAVATAVSEAGAPPPLRSSAETAAREGGMAVAGAEVAGAARGGAHLVRLLLQSSKRLCEAGRTGGEGRGCCCRATGHSLATGALNVGDWRGHHAHASARLESVSAQRSAQRNYMSN